MAGSMNQKPSQLRLVLSWSQAVASRICAFAARGCRAMSAIGEIPSCEWHDAMSPERCNRVDEAGGNGPPASSMSAIDALQLPFRDRDRAGGGLAAGAVVGEHVDHQEVGDRSCRLLAGLADAGR